MPYSINIIRLLEKVDPTLREVLLAILEEIEKQRKQWEETVTKTEFNELKQIVSELAEAQKRTEEELKKLVGEHRKTREQLGGLAHTVGYILEDRAYESLPDVLEKELGIKVKELKRDFVEIAPIKKRDVDSFLKKVARVERHFPREKIFVMVTYQVSPQVRSYIEEKGIKLYLSYQLKMPRWL